jgi:hypothetical protein
MLMERGERAKGLTPNKANRESIWEDKVAYV